MPMSKTARDARTQEPPDPPPLAVPVTDSHTHLDMQDAPVAEALRRAAAVGVTRVVQIGCDVARARWAVRTAAEHPSVRAAVGLHPNEAPRLEREEGPGALDRAFGEIAELAALPQVVAIGETGLDHFRTGEEGRAAQELSFRRHIALAKELDRTLVIHDRDAHQDVLRVLAEEGAPERTVFHCFSGDARMARYCAERGYYLSFAGNVTFKSAQPLRDALAAAPPELLLVETDAPFLTPVPYRGRPNAPYLIPYTVRAMAEVTGLDEETLAGRIAVNSARAFAW
jgi:TatD DNase family protein